MLSYSGWWHDFVWKGRGGGRFSFPFSGNALEGWEVDSVDGEYGRSEDLCIVSRSLKLDSFIVWLEPFPSCLGGLASSFAQQQQYLRWGDSTCLTILSSGQDPLRRCSFPTAHTHTHTDTSASFPRPKYQSNQPRHLTPLLPFQTPIVKSCSIPGVTLAMNFKNTTMY